MSTIHCTFCGERYEAKPGGIHKCPKLTPGRIIEAPLPPLLKPPRLFLAGFLAGFGYGVLFAVAVVWLFGV